MLENNNNLETLFKSNFEDFNIEPSNKVWENIEKNLNNNEVNKNVNKFSMAKILLLTFSFISITFLVVYNFNKNNAEQLNVMKLSEKKSKITNQRFYNFQNLNKTKIVFVAPEAEVVENYNLTNLKNELSSSNQFEETKIIEGISNVMNITIFVNEKNKTENNIKCFQNISNEKTSKNEKFSTSQNAGCEPLNVKFENTIENSQNIIWSFGDGETSNLKNPEYTYFDAGIYCVCLQYEQNNQILKIYDTVIVNQTPEAQFSVNQTKGIMTEDEIEFSNNSLNADSYLWNFGDNNKSIDYEPIHKFISTGAYDIKLFAYSNNGCIDSSFLTLNVEFSKYNIVFPNAFYPNVSGSTGGAYSLNYNKNEVFYPSVANEIDDYILNIYTKNNDLIFHSEKLEIGWDGYYNDKMVETGVYIYEVKGKYTNGNVFRKKGDVTVLKK